MPKKKHKAISLSQATKILRAHSTQINPPGLLEMKNLYLSRSDSAIGLRSDWEPVYDGMFSYSDILQDDDQEDYLNNAFYVSRAGHTIWFGRLCPFTWDGGAFGQLFTIYDTGTISTDGHRKEVNGEGTSWLQQVWPGCLIKEKGEGNDLYVVDYVSSDTRLVTTEVMDGLGGAEYEIFRVHPATRAEWPIRLASLGGYLVYGTVDINQPIDSRFISGPFYSNIGRPNLGVWFGTDPISDAIEIPTAAIYVGKSYSKTHPQNDFFPLAIGGDKGAVFARNWFGDPQGTQDEAYSVNAGSIENISFLGHRDLHALTVAGDVIDVQNGNKVVSEEAVQHVFDDNDNVITKTRPFGTVELYDWEEYIVGAGGLLGIQGGTTYATGVSVALRGVSTHADGATDYTVVVGDADVTDGVILHFTAPGSITRATSGTAESFNDVAYSRFHDRLCAVGTNGECMTSDDKGATWTGRTSGAAVDLLAVACDDEGHCFCAVGKADTGVGQAFVSIDGITWSQQTWTISGPTEDLVDVKFNTTDGCFYTTTSSGKIFRIRRRIQVEPPGTDLGSFGTASDFVCDVEHHAGLFVAVGTGIWTSPDAVTWTLRETPSVTLTGVAANLYNGTTWVAVGVGGVVYRSTNSGVTWAAVSSGVTVDLRGVIYDGDSAYEVNFIAIGKQGTVIRSADGSGWSKMSFPTTSDILCIGFSGNLAGGAVKNLYISAQDGKIYTNYNHQGGSPYDNWARWDSQPTEAYDQDQYWAEDPLPPRFRAALSSNTHLQPIIAIGGCTFSMRAQFIASTGQLFGVTDLSDVAQAAVLFRTGPVMTDGLGNHYQQIMGANSISVLNFETYTPIMVARYYQVMNSGPIAGSNGHYILTSTDGGRTWSTMLTMSGDDYWQYPQQIQFYGATPPNVAGLNYLPICNDGTDFFVIQSTAIYPAAPQAVKLDSIILDTIALEIE